MRKCRKIENLAHYKGGTKSSGPDQRWRIHLMSRQSNGMKCARTNAAIPEYLAHLERGAAHSAERGDNALGIGLVEQEASLQSGTALRTTSLCTERKRLSVQK
jgi:hypothetical protein